MRFPPNLLFLGPSHCDDFTLDQLLHLTVEVAAAAMAPPDSVAPPYGPVVENITPAHAVPPHHCPATGTSYSCTTSQWNLRHTVLASLPIIAPSWRKCDRSFLCCDA
ncbi:hypothetical protein L3X38_042769 [Prunus dulcis]|uniref:Uncharacterized protein n=1 Tax=Prunus dulcis TaxID=3755 RepID=A0AAD4UVT3_PRUDU|nr:hypothetical protein L3X38_042769 [Prunus dulcis]